MGNEKAVEENYMNQLIYRDGELSNEPDFKKYLLWLADFDPIIEEKGPVRLIVYPGDEKDPFIIVVRSKVTRFPTYMTAKKAFDLVVNIVRFKLEFAIEESID